jgi:hypothetical protein
MKSKRAFFAVLLVFLVSMANSTTVAVDTSGIKNVRDKEVLSSEDLQIIDNFVDEAIQELVRTEDFTAIANVRAVLLARVSSNRRSAEAQYTEQFFESAHKHISRAFRQVGESEYEDRRFKVMVNLMILVDGLENPRLADLALGMLKEENTVIRYWAVHSLTNSGFTKQLSSGKPVSLQLAGRIAEQLKEVVEVSAPETLALMAEFAADVNVPQGENLLLQIADIRTKKYADWAVDYELLDGTVLKSLCKKIPPKGPGKPDVARRFGQLYSYVIQRYINGRNSLSATQRQQLASALVETEKSCVSKLLEMPQASIVGIKRAIENEDYVSLLQEHNKLLGDEKRPGLLPSKLKFYYLNPDATKRTAPLVLPKPPKIEARK